MITLRHALRGFRTLFKPLFTSSTASMRWVFEKWGLPVSRPDRPRARTKRRKPTRKRKGGRKRKAGRFT